MTTSKIKRKVNIITFRMEHHAGRSGYDRLADYIDNNLITGSPGYTFGERLTARVFRNIIQRSGSRWYHRDCFIAELRTAKQWLKESGQIFHFIYGENNYRYLGHLKSINKNNAIVCTYHTPSKRFHEVVNYKRHINKADAVIVVSTVQKEMFADAISPERVHYVPHGIDVEYFVPKGDREDRVEGMQCLFVGSHLRDLDTLAAAAKIIKDKKEDIKLNVVTSPDYRSLFHGLENVNFCSGISDEELLQMYQTSDLYVMPLLDCTANNGLLEAMACGLPIISTDLQGVRDYVDKKCAILTPRGEVNTLADKIMMLKREQATRKEMSIASRDRALEFRWENIAEKVTNIYNKL